MYNDKYFYVDMTSLYQIMIVEIVTIDMTDNKAQTANNVFNLRWPMW